MNKARLIEDSVCVLQIIVNILLVRSVERIAWSSRTRFLRWTVPTAQLGVTHQVLAQLNYVSGLKWRVDNGGDNLRIQRLQRLLVDLIRVGRGVRADEKLLL